MKRILADHFRVVLFIFSAIAPVAYAFDSDDFVGSTWLCTNTTDEGERTVLYLRPNGRYNYRNHERDGKWKVNGKTIVFYFNVEDGGRVLGRTVFSGKFSNRGFFYGTSVFSSSTDKTDRSTWNLECEAK